jgi:hypothetical protein
MKTDGMGLKLNTLGTKLNSEFNIFLGTVKGGEYMHGKVVGERIMID